MSYSLLCIPHISTFDKELYCTTNALRPVPMDFTGLMVPISLKKKIGRLGECPFKDLLSVHIYMGTVINVL